MCYYYTIKEYATTKGLALSAHEEAEAVAFASLLSNERGVPINKIHCGNSNRNLNCYALRILRDTFRPAGKKENRSFETSMAGAPA